MRKTSEVFAKGLAKRKYPQHPFVFSKVFCSECDNKNSICTVLFVCQKVCFRFLMSFAAHECPGGQSLGYFCACFAEGAGGHRGWGAGNGYSVRLLTWPFSPL